MATTGITGVYRKQVVANAGDTAVEVIVPPGLIGVTLYYKGGAGTNNKVQKTVSSGEEIRAGTAVWIDVTANVTNTEFDDTNKKVMGDETVVAFRALRNDQDVTLVVTGQLIPQ